MVKSKPILVLSIMTALAGCGGSGTGGSPAAVTPPPTPTPTPTPVPAPTNTTLTNLVASQVFSVASASTLARFGGALVTPPVGQFQPYNAGPLTFTYEQPVGSYHLNISANPPRFGPTAAVTTSNFQTFGAVDGVGSRLILFRPGSTNTTSALSFVSYGLFRSNETVSSSAADLTYRNYIYGLPTAAADVPRTGTATYTTTTDGVWIKTNEDFNAQISGLQEIRITGVSTTTVNFAANTLTFTLTITGPDTRTGRTLTIASLAGTGTIAASGVITGNVTGGTYSYTFVETANPVSIERRVTYGFGGPFSGAFFGPSGAELGLAFQLAPDAAPNRAASVSGAIVGKR